MVKSHTSYSVKIITDFFVSLFFFPLWWYTKGLVKIVKGLISYLKEREKSLALFVWVKNIFTPMYGESDWQGKIISFIVRVAQIIIRGIAMFIILITAILFLAFWLLLPLIVVYGILFQIFY